MVSCLSDIPKIEQYPVDVLADEGDTVSFRCSAAGDGDISVYWEKQGGNTNQNKWRTLSNNTLQIEDVDSADVGTYVCKAENAVGSAEAVARLNIECEWGKLTFLSVLL